MSQDSEETLRLIVMLGQAFLPPVQELMAFVFRQVGRATCGVGSIAAAGAKQAALAPVRALADATYGMGRVGVVRDSRDLGGPTTLYEVTEFFRDREDVQRLNDMCREVGIGVHVLRNGEDGGLAVEFRTRDVAKFDWAMGSLFAKALGPDRLAEELADDEGRLPPGWKLSPDGKTATRDVQALHDQIYRAVARVDGTWSMSAADGSTAKLGGAPLEGSAPANPDGRATDAQRAYLADLLEKKGKDPSVAEDPNLTVLEANDMLNGLKAPRLDLRAEWGVNRPDGGAAAQSPAGAAPYAGHDTVPLEAYDGMGPANPGTAPLPPDPDPVPLGAYAGIAAAARSADLAAATVADPAVREHAATEAAREAAAARPDSTKVSAKDLIDGVNGRGPVAEAGRRQAAAKAGTRPYAVKVGDRTVGHRQGRAPRKPAAKTRAHTRKMG